MGKIDVLFVNAGIAKNAPSAETSESTFDEQFDINSKGAYFTIQKALPLLLTLSYGQLANTASAEMVL